MDRLKEVIDNIKAAITGWLEDFPCNVVGHRWVEIPAVLRRSRKSDGHRMRFRCSRCSMTGGFSNLPIGG